jgi:hypothetical protein
MSATTTTNEAPPRAEPPDEAPRLAQFVAWATIVVPILAWTVHMVGCAALIEYTCEHPGARWVLHGLTISLALVTIVCIAIAWRSAHLPNGEEAVSTRANLRFLAHMALIVGIANLMLIGAEGLYVLFFSSCAKS